MAETLIIGAGPAGLTAAYELSKMGLRSSVIEADTQVGGLSRTVDYNGYRFDIGGHRFFSKVPLINELWREILQEEFLIRPRLSRIYYREHFFDYPLKAVNALAGLGPVEAAFILMSYARAKLAPSKDETNFEQWVANRFGYRLYEIFFKTYTEKVWGVPCSEISADWASQRIKNLSLQEALRNALFGSGRASDGQVITTLIDAFHYPRLGPGMMWEHCEQILADRGSATTRGIKIEKIRHRNGRVESVLGRSASGEQVEMGADNFVSTMPLRKLIFALDPAPPDEVLKAATDLHYRDYLTVVLIVNRDSIFPDNWIYIHSPEVKMGRIQNYKNWSPDMVPDASRTSLGLEYFLQTKEDMWGWSQDRLVEMGIKECAQIGIIEPGEVEDGTVVRMKKAYPVYDHRYRENLGIIRRYLETIPNLQTIGRNGLHRYNNQDHSMLTGVYAARNIAGDAYDVWSVNTEMEYHEEGELTGRAAGDRLVPVSMVEAARSVQAANRIIEEVFAKVDPVALGLATGLVSGVALFLATAVLLLRGGDVVGPNLSLLANYLIEFEVSWKGALIGAAEAGLGGFTLGFMGAWLRNWSMAAYAALLRRQAQARAQSDLLDKV